jgi:hypothetical protein
METAASRDAKLLTKWNEICEEVSSDEDFLRGAEIYTDGSWAQTAETIDKIFMRVRVSTHLSIRQHNNLLKE